MYFEGFMAQNIGHNIKIQIDCSCSCVNSDLRVVHDRSVEALSSCFITCSNESFGLVVITRSN